MTESGRDCLIKNTDNNNHNNNNNNNNIRIDRYCLICLVIKNWYMYTLYFRRGFFCVSVRFSIAFFFWKQHVIFFYYEVWSTILGGVINFFYKYFRVICNILAPWIFNDYSWGICDEFVTIIFNHSHIS